MQGRFAAWLNPFDQAEYDAVGGSFQLVTGLFGFANGGLIGTGLGQGRPQTTPLAESDYIFASLGEELGLAGLFAILALYLLLVSRGFRIGFVGQDDFGRMLGVGVSLRRRPAGLRRHGRRDAGHPAHRSHDAVPRRRRLVARGELDHRRAAAAPVRRGPQPTEAGGRLMNKNSNA